jgi:hypothetical protein
MDTTVLGPDAASKRVDVNLDRGPSHGRRVEQVLVGRRDERQFALTTKSDNNRSLPRTREI